MTREVGRVSIMSPRWKLRFSLPPLTGRRAIWRHLYTRLVGVYWQSSLVRLVTQALEDARQDPRLALILVDRKLASHPIPDQVLPNLRLRAHLLLATSNAHQPHSHSSLPRIGRDAHKGRAEIREGAIHPRAPSPITEAP